MVYLYIEFKVSQGYIMIPCLKKLIIKKTRKREGCVNGHASKVKDKNKKKKGLSIFRKALHLHAHRFKCLYHNLLSSGPSLPTPILFRTLLTCTAHLASACSHYCSTCHCSGTWCPGHTLLLHPPWSYHTPCCCAPESTPEPYFLWFCRWIVYCSLKTS